MSRSNKYHVVAAFTATGATLRDRSWSEAFSRIPGGPHGVVAKVMRAPPPSPIGEVYEDVIAGRLNLAAIENSLARGPVTDKQMRVETVLPDGKAHPPFFVDVHPVQKVPLQLIVYEEEFDSAGEALKWLETPQGRVFAMHADYVTVLFTGA